MELISGFESRRGLLINSSLRTAPCKRTSKSPQLVRTIVAIVLRFGTQSSRRLHRSCDQLFRTDDIAAVLAKGDEFFEAVEEIFYELGSQLT